MQATGPGVASHPRLMIATPACGGLVHTDYVTTLLDLARTGLAFGLVTLGDESLVTRARNALAASFHARREYTHLLFLDAGVGLAAEGILRLVAHDRDVVAAPVPLAGRGARGERLFDVGLAVGEDGPLSLHERVGAAALMLSRRAVDALVDDAKVDGRVYECPSTLSGDAGARVHYDVFRAGVVDGDYLSEDAWACDALRRLGFAIHVDPAIVVRRHGTRCV